MTREWGGASDTFRQLIAVAIDSAMSSVSEGSVAPSMLSLEKGEIDIVVFPNISFEEFRKRPSKLSRETEAYVLVYLASVERGGVTYEAIIVEGAERGQPTGHKVVQLYLPGPLADALGDPVYAGPSEQLMIAG